MAADFDKKRDRKSTGAWPRNKPEQRVQAKSKGDSSSGTPLFLQRSPASPAAPMNDEAAAEPAQTATAAEPAAGAADLNNAPARVLIVEDSVEELEPGQLRRSEFLALLRAEVTNAAEDALSGTIWSALGCPWVDRWFNYYGERNSGQIERAIYRYSPEANGITTAGDLIPIICGRVRNAITAWSTTGEMTQDVPTDLPVAAGAGAEGGDSPSETGNVLMKEREGASGESDSPGVIQGDLGSGSSLDAGVKSNLESAYGEDFSRVRVHTGASAASVSDSLNARAFTIGEDIAFGANEYQPGTPIGDALIAHELAHVKQQRGGRVAVESKQDGAAAQGALEEDADQAAVGAVLSTWGMAKSRVAHISQNAMPQLKSGLRLQRCSKKSSGAIDSTRLAQAGANFRSNNDHLTTAELQKIDDALKAVTGDNLNLWIRFYDYYSSHDIKKMDAEEERKAIALDVYAETKPNNDTKLRPDLLGAGFSTTTLGTALVHEFVHTRHDTNYMGFRDYQEGDSYAIEHVIAVRAGDTARARAILDIMYNPTTIAKADQVPALKSTFKAIHATMQGLYEIVDKGSSSHSASPFVTLTPDEAKALIAELVSSQEDDRSQQLQDVITWAKANPASFTLPI